MARRRLYIVVPTATGTHTRRDAPTNSIGKSRMNHAATPMDLLDRLLEHDAWTTALLIDRARELRDEELDREFDIGHRSVRATLGHIIFNTEVWAALMAGEPAPRADEGDETLDGFAARLERAAAQLAEVARVVSDRRAWDERWLDVMDEPPAEKTYGGAIAHVLTHSMHHRAQLLFILRQLGLANLPEGDVLTWEQRLTDPT